MLPQSSSSEWVTAMSLALKCVDVPGNMGVPAQLPVSPVTGTRPVAVAQERYPTRRRFLGSGRAWLKWTVPALLVVAAASDELRTSRLQAWAFSSYAEKVSYRLEPGPSSQIAFPADGPFDVRRGYTRLPQFVARLEREGYEVISQSRLSPELIRLVQWGIHPPYVETPATGLRIRTQQGRALYDAASDRRLFDTFEGIPPAITRFLLFIENRELQLDGISTANPAVEWDRLGKAGLLYAGSKIGLPLTVEGGSTLAVQLEKFRHFPRGMTGSPLDKLRQIAGASLKVYRTGPDTQARRREIVVEYLNTLPLAAQVGYGEVYGLGEGLHAWFGQDLAEVLSALSSPSPDAQARAVKHVLSLLCSVRAPSHYLISNRNALERRVANYTQLFEVHGLLDPDLAKRVRATPLSFLDRAPPPHASPIAARKHLDSVRTNVLRMLGVSDYYELDQLDLEIETSIDPDFQSEVMHLLDQLKDPEFAQANGLGEFRLLGSSDPGPIVYGLTLFERTPTANLLRVQADTLDRPFDLNQGMKMELGSTAKLRTTAHYLQLVATLHADLALLDEGELTAHVPSRRDPITEWAVRTLQDKGPVPLDTFLDLALERQYSASPGEAFFTGGGRHTFGNFDAKDNHRMLSVREAFQRSTNLVFIRLMRDLVRFHQARLPYDIEAVLSDSDNPIRRAFLIEAGDFEAQQILARAFRAFRGLSEDELVERLLRTRSQSARPLSMLYLAWNPGATVSDLESWLAGRVGRQSPIDAERLFQSYDPARLNLRDYGYLIGRHPLEVWAAGALRENPDLSWNALLAQSGDARTVVSDWLLKTKNRRAQDTRLRARIERDAFERMTPHWQQLGFAFDTLVPSLATAIGNSSDRPIALAELMGVILNDGVRLPALRVTRLHAAAATPYETLLTPRRDAGVRVLPPPVARALRALLAQVVEKGTARRLAGAFAREDGTPVTAGGKTGSGDNRYETYSRGGGVISSRVVNRTATFVFYVGDRYFGVVTAHVDGEAARNYRFTSALPVTVLKLLAPSINRRLENSQKGPNTMEIATAERQCSDESSRIASPQHDYDSGVLESDGLTRALHRDAPTWGATLTKTMSCDHVGQ